MIKAGQYTFHFDVSACSGCMACQVACKDKHQLEVGRRWRRVYEVSGGGWRLAGDAWITDAFAYHYSVACNHCETPICAEVCPTAAIRKRPDGIVLLDAERCLGCGYCSWACPYDALQYDHVAGRMSKCTFCVDEIDAGHSPACVAACPMRVLDYRFQRLSEPGENGRSSGTYPLPAPGLTHPALVIHSHKDETRGQLEPVNVRPASPSYLNAWPLILFTLLVQLAVGSTLVLAFIRVIVAGQSGRDMANNFGAGLSSVLVLAMITGLIISTLHLGNPRIAYRALANWSSSWLSREIGLSLLFTTLVTVFAIFQWVNYASYLARSVLLWAAGLVGLILVFAMSRVYRLRTVPGWFRPGTAIYFFSTTFMLGGIVGSVVISGAISGAAGQAVNLFGGKASPVAFWWGMALLLLFVFGRLAGIMRADGGGFKSSGRWPTRFWPAMLLALAGTGAAVIILFGGFHLMAGWLSAGLALAAFGLILISELLERHRFYQAYCHQDRQAGGLKSV